MKTFTEVDLVGVDLVSMNHVDKLVVKLMYATVGAHGL